MKFRKQSVGVDISKDDFHVHFLAFPLEGHRYKIRGSRKFSNTAKGHKAFHRWVAAKRQQGVDLTIALEATGVYHEELTYYLHDQGYALTILLPNKVKAFGRSLNEYSKSDPRDSLLIARMALERSLRRWQPASKCMRRLRHLTRERQSLIRDRVRHGNQLHALQYSHEPNKKTIRRQEVIVNLLNRQVDAIDREIDLLRQEDDKLDEAFSRLESIPQVSTKTAAVVIAETGNFVLFESRAQLIKYAGMDIVERQSGTSVRGKSKMSKRGNSRLRSALYMPSIGYPSRKGPIGQIYDRVLARTDCKMKALVAVQRKLLIIMYALAKTRQMYDEAIHAQRSQRVDEPESSPTVTQSGLPQPVLVQN